MSKSPAWRYVVRSDGSFFRTFMPTATSMTSATKNSCA